MKARGKTRKTTTPFVGARPRWWLRLLTLMALVAVFVGVFQFYKTWIEQPEHLTINDLRWEGQFKRIKREDLNAIAVPYLNTNLHLLAAEELEVALESSSWVRDAKIYKRWPQQLLIKVEEQKPIARWGEENLLNKYGEIFSADLPDSPEFFPTIMSKRTSGREMALQYVDLSTALVGTGLLIALFSEDESGSWRIRFDSGPEVVIGRKAQEKRLERFRVGYQHLLQDKFGAVKQVDLRYANGFAVTWKSSKVSQNSLIDRSMLSMGETE